MAKREQVTVVDDLNGAPADETVQFGLDGVTYEIDLSEANATKLRDSLARYVESARRVGERARQRRTAKPGRNGLDLYAVRAWARSQGYEVSDRGRVPASIVEDYERGVAQRYDRPDGPSAWRH